MLRILYYNFKQLMVLISDTINPFCSFCLTFDVANYPFSITKRLIVL